MRKLFFLLFPSLNKPLGQLTEKEQRLLRFIMDFISCLFITVFIILTSIITVLFYNHF